MSAPRMLYRLEVAGRDWLHVGRALDQSPRLGLLRAQNVAQALVFLLGSPHLPGETAQDRLRFVLAYLNEGGLPVRLPMGRAGLRPALLGPDEEEVGAGPGVVFLAAMARADAAVGVVGRLMVHREVVALAALAGAPLEGAPWRVRGAFVAAVAAVEAERDEEAVALCLQAGLPAIAAWGWALGAAIRRGSVRSPRELGRWVEGRLRDPTWPLGPEPMKTW
ncbi:MAG: hypothetical protein KC933_00300 [Myxococcales bacterium]|nr:hypothetical protein [Myxococcales bacterium]MCB9649563.1 hypothetical protein [Deltaproteobacteria bacterium]